MPACMMTYPHAPSTHCVLPIDHDGPHVTRSGHGWHDSDDMDGGVTAALIEKEAEPTDVWRRRAEKAEDRADDAHNLIVALRADLAATEARAEDTLSLAQQDPDSAIRQRDEYHNLLEKAERERDEAREDRNDALRREKAEQDRAIRAERSRDLALARAERAECHDCVADAAVIREPRPLTPRQNLAALWESAHRPVGGRIPAGTAIITRSDYGNGDVRYRTLEATGRDLPDPGYTLERNYNYGPENGEEYRLLDPPARPDWIDAPAVRAWHKSDLRTEHDGTPGRPRIWSPDYGTTDVWSTPSLPHVPWSDLVDVEPLHAPEDGAA